jgi:H+/Cl- antiporter ClcA
MVFLPLVAGRWMPATRQGAGGAACHEHGPVFASAARVPLTSFASAVEMTGEFTLTLPVMLDVEIATPAD